MYWVRNSGRGCRSQCWNQLCGWLWCTGVWESQAQRKSDLSVTAQRTLEHQWHRSLAPIRGHRGCAGLSVRQVLAADLSWGESHTSQSFLGEVALMDHFWGKEAAVDFWQLTCVISGDGHRKHLTEARSAPSTAVTFCHVGFRVDRRGFVTLWGPQFWGTPRPQWLCCPSLSHCILFFSNQHSDAQVSVNISSLELCGLTEKENGIKTNRYSRHSSLPWTPYSLAI